MTGTDEVTVVASVMKLSDAAPSIVCEFSISSFSKYGAFHLAAMAGGATKYQLAIRGAGAEILTNTSLETYKAPHKGVISGYGNTGASSKILRVNGVQVGSSGTSAGAGNFSIQKLYIGRRAGTTVPFKGRLYGLTILGTLVPDTDLALLEARHAAIAGITL